MFRTNPKDLVYFRGILEEGSDDDSHTGAAGIDKLEDEEISHPKSGRVTNAGTAVCGSGFGVGHDCQGRYGACHH